MTLRTVPFALVAILLFGACGREGERSVSLPTPSASVATATPNATDDPSARPSVSPTASPVASATPTATAIQAKAAFLANANAACREATDRLDAMADPQDVDDLPPFLETFIGIIDDLNAKLRGFTPPAEDADEVDEYIDGNDAQRKALADALPEVRAAAETNDADRADRALDKAFTEFQRIADEQDPWARGYGLEDCVEPETTSNTVEA